jgi:hypothetical protein
MSGFPTKARAAPAAREVIHYRDHIRIVAPAADAAAPPDPRLRPSAKQAEQAPHQAYWHDHVRAWRDSGLKRAAYAERHGLELRTLNQWIARLRHTFYRHPKAASGRA